MISTILWLIVLACLLVIGLVIAKHWQQLLSGGHEGVDAYQDGVKKRILEQRLERHLIVQGNKILISVKPFLQMVMRFAKIIGQKIIEVEQKYRSKLLKQNFAKKVDQQQFLHQKIKEATSLINDKKFIEAEKKYIEILTLDERNASAYWGLSKLYVDQEDYDQAFETLKFLLKLQPGHNQARKLLAQVAGQKGDLVLAKQCLEQLIVSEPKDISCYLSLAAAEMGLDNPGGAQIVLQKGLIIEANNPKLLDFLIEVSIVMHDVDTANEAIRTLQLVNPDNAKIEEFKKKINEI